MRNHSHASDLRLDALEPRQLLTTYTPSPILDRYAVPTDELFVIQAPAGTVGFGAASAALGDLDGDGADDFAISAPGATGGVTVNGSVFVYSGKTRALLVTIGGGTPAFGSVLASVGDLSGDGRQDLFIGAPDHDYAGVYSAFDGDLLLALTGDPGSQFGFSVAALDDVDNDGTDDLAIGAPSQDGHGAVFIISGDDGVTIRRIDGPMQAGSRFGHAVSNYLDIAGSDGVGELVVGAPNYDTTVGGTVKTNAGAYFAYNSVSGAQAAKYDASPWSGGHVGYSILFDATRSYLFVGAPTEGADGDQPAGGWIHAVGGFEGDFAHPPIPYASRNAGEQMGLALILTPSLRGGTAPELLAVTGMGTTLFAATADIALPSARKTIAAARLIPGDFNADTIPDLLGTAWVDPPAALARGLSAFSFYPPPNPVIFSRDGGYIVASSRGISLTSYTTSYIATADSFTPLSMIPALDDNLIRIDTISNDGWVAGRVDGGPSNLHSPFLVDLANPTVRVYISDLVQTIVGPTPDFDEMDVVFFADSGAIYLRELFGGGSARAWKLVGDTLTYMWEGLPLDEAADGTVLGINYPGNPDEVVLWKPGQGVTAHFPTVANAWRFSPDGSILGVSLAGELVVIRDDAVVRLLPAGEGPNHTWNPVGIDENGRVIAQSQTSRTYTYYDIRGGSHIGTVTTIRTILIDTNGVSYELDSRVVQPIPNETYGLDTDEGFLDRFPVIGPQTLIELLPDGTILTSTYHLDALEGDALILAGEQIYAAPGEFGPTVVAVTPLGRVFSLVRKTDSTWVTVSYPELDGFSTVNVYVDPKDRQTYIIAFGNFTLPDETRAAGLVYRQLADGTLADPQVVMLVADVAAAITTHLTVFKATDGRVHAAGLSATGDIIMVYQTGNTFDGRFEWSYDNITVNHLEPQGFASPGWTSVSPLTTYVAPWNGLNIAGLDADGDIRVVWWAPGKVYWSADNLSLITGMAPLSGSLTSYVTSWGGLNVAGVDAEANLQVAWWVPGFGTQWRTNNMTEEFSGPTMRNAAAYVNAWGGLNIAGYDQQGAVVVYWWTPGMDDWRSDPVSLGVRMASPNWKLAVTPVPVIRGAEQNLIMTDLDGYVLRLWWNPTMGPWAFDNLSVTAQ